MRIISGMAKGIQLRAPSGEAVRPTADRVREALFSALGDVTDLTVFDLFAGTGALGLEALSRGAGSVTFVESNRRHAAVLRENLQNVQNADSRIRQRPARVLVHNVRHLAHRVADQASTIDLILADPPYRSSDNGMDASELVTDDAFARWSAGARLVLEHPAEIHLPASDNRFWAIEKQKCYGRTKISFLTNTVCQPVDH